MGKAARLASTILLMQWLLWMQPQALPSDDGGTSTGLRLAASQEAVREAKKPPGSSSLPENLLAAIGERTGREKAIEQRIASVLQKLGKTLILEGTRGAKEVELYQRAAPAVVLVLTNGDRLGSGAIIDGQGHVITNWHVVGSEPDVVVVFKPKDSTEPKKELAFWATVEKVDQVTDLALLKIRTPPNGPPFLPLGDVSTLAVGQDVHAIGHPRGEAWTYTKGIISQIRPNYTWSTSDGVVHRAKVIQTQTPVNPGNSGGPLLDDNGKLVGVNSFRGQGEGLNYAVAVDEVQEFLQRRESRPAPGSQHAGAAKEEIQCPELYDTPGRGWSNIYGCYLGAISPPPDLWLVYRVLNGPAAYLATDSKRTWGIDTVMKPRDPEWRIVDVYIDSGCKGTVDLVGTMRGDSGEIGSYRRPSERLLMTTLASDIDRALKQKQLPYPNLRVCQ